jgi:hypothetical protein
MADDVPLTEVDLAALGPRTRIGTGGQGTVHALERHPGLVYKEYAPHLVDDVDVTTLVRFTRLAADADETDRSLLLALAAWPVSVVRKDGVVRGFLMPRVPEPYRMRLSLPRGPVTVLAQVQYLLNDDDYLAARDLAVTDRLRLELLRDTAEALDLFHRLDIAVGDLSPNNLLFSQVTRPRCYFIDCDTMRLAGDCVLTPAETPEWQVPGPGDDAGPAEELATPATDAYKLGLLAVRLFAGDQQARDPAAVRYLPRQVRDLAERSLVAEPDERVQPAGWLAGLDTALARLTPAGAVRGRPEPRPWTRRATRTTRPAAPGAEPRPAPPPAPPPGPRPAPTGPGRRWRTRLPGWTARIGRGWWVAGAIWAVAVVCVGLLQDGPSEPITPPALPALPTGFDGLPPRGQPLPGVSGQPVLPPGFPLPLDSLLPQLPTPSLCLLLRPETSSGRGLSRAERREADAAIGDFLCGLSRNDAEQAFAGTGTPSATQRSRLATVGRRGTLGPVTVVDVDTGSAGRRRVTAVFQVAPGAGGRPACWRSRLTVVRSGDGISSMTAPVRVRCP